MRIEHIAVWVDDLEVMREFYLTYFDAVSNDKYVNAKKGYSSYFITFSGGGARIELMHRTDISEVPAKRGLTKGLAHLAISLGSKDGVDMLTERLRTDGYVIAGEPRTSGDGYYESVVLDPEGNYIELVG